MQAVDRVLPACATGRRSVSFTFSRIARRIFRSGAGLATLLLPWLLAWPAADADAAYVRRYAVTTRGAITFTGNTLGLSRDSDAAGLTTPGTRSSIGAFSTIDIGQQVGSYPAGTTSDWRLNSAAANLVLPPGAAVLHAELIWGGSIRFGGDDVSAFLNNAVHFTVPGGTPVDVTPDPASAQQTGDGSYYVRSADVTALVRAAGAGAYVAGGVPGTLGTSNTSNTAGWTLAVVYNDGAAPVRNMTVFVGAEKSGSDPAAVSGFCTPPSGPVNGRVLVTALEGDASDTGDTFLFGRVLPLGTANRLSGPNNPITNFFSSQINGDNGLLDTSGTFGTRNHNAATHTNIVGGRQGWDITNVDGSAQLINNQSGAYAQGTTNGEAYAVAGIGIQIDAYAPSFPVMVKTVDKAAAVVGDVLTYTVTLHNSGQALARNVAFRDGVPPGTSFVPGSFTIGGVAQPGVTDPGTVVPIGNIAAGASVVVSFQVRVDSVPTDRTIRNAAHWVYLYDTCRRLFLRGSVDTNEVVTTVPAADLQISKTDGAAFYTPGAPISYTVVVDNPGPDAASGFDVADTVPAAITGVTAVCAFTGTGACGSNASAGNNVLFQGASLAAGGRLTLTVAGTVSPAATGTLANTATVAPGVGAGFTDPNLGNNAATDTDVAGAPPASADLSITKTDGSASATSGMPLTYTIVVRNAGPSDVAGATVTDTLPAAITGATWTVAYAGSASGPASGSGDINAAVNLPVGGTATFTLTGTIAANATGLLSNTATVNPPAGIPDPNPVDNSATDTDTVVARSDLTITKTDGSATYAPGGTVTYTITAANAGPSAAVGVRVTDTLPEPISGAIWTVAYAGGANGPAGGNGNIDTTVNLPVGATATFTLTGTVSNTASGSLANTATVAPAAGAIDPNPANNAATDSDASIPLPALTVAKTATPASFLPGQPASYSITLSNTGTAATTGSVTLTDTLPAGVTLASASGADWSCTGTSALVCTYAGLLAPGASATLTLDVNVDASAASGDNSATATGGGDPACPDLARCTASVGVSINHYHPVPIDARGLLLAMTALFLAVGAGRRRNRVE